MNEPSWYDAFTATGHPIVILAVLVIGLAALVLAFATAGRDRIGDRLDRVVRREQRAARGETPDEETSRPRRSVAEGTASVLRAAERLVGSVTLANEKEQGRIRAKLLNAGFRDPDAVSLFLTAKVLVALVLLSGAGLVAFGTTVLPDLMIAKAGVLLIGAYTGMTVPEHIVGSMAKTRQKAIARSLPDAVDLMIICANAGYSIDLAITRVGREIRHASPEMAEELLVTADELRALTDRREALRNLADRNAVENLRGLVSTLLQAQKYGTPLTQALRTLAAEARSARMLALEERGARLPALISVPLMTLILPAVFIIVAGPAFIKVAQNFTK